MARKIVMIGGPLLVALVAAYWQFGPPTDERVSAAIWQEDNADGLSRQAPAPRSVPDDSGRVVEAEDQRFGLSDEELARTKRRYQFEQAAEQRFRETADMDGLTPESVKPEVRHLFRTLKLKPEYDLREGQQGYVNGMRVDRMASSNPLAKAGFRVGDRLTRINGEVLRDPAMIAHLVTRIDSSMEVCASRAGNRFCRQVTLESPSGG